MLNARMLNAEVNDTFSLYFSIQHSALPQATRPATSSSNPHAFQRLDACVLTLSSPRGSFANIH